VGAVTLTGAYGLRDKDVPTASFGTLFNQQHPREHTTDRRAMLDAQYERTFNGTRVAGRASFDRYSYEGVYPLPGDDESSVLVNHDSALGTRWGVDGRVTRSLPGRQVLTVGAEFLHNIHQNQRNTYEQPTGLDFDIERSSRQGAIYAQDEVRLHRRVLVNAGVRYDRHGGAERITPRAALIVTRSANESFKYLYGTAFRAPNVYELDYHSAGARNAALKPESIDTHEVVWERYASDWLRTSSSAYWYDAKRLISQRVDPETFDGLSFVNADRARARGLELEAEVRLKNGSHSLVSYALQRATDEATGAVLTNSPRQMAKLRVSVPVRANRSFASIDVQYLSSRRSVAGSAIGPVAVAHLTLRERIGRRLEIVGAVRNLFDRRNADPASDEHLQDSIPQEGRTFRIELRWAFWTA
jgi:iron complex outermembrane receptor protein